MKNKLGVLLKMQFMGSFGINKLLHSKRKDKALSLGGGIAGVALLFLLIEGLIFFYAWIFAAAFAEIQYEQKGALYMSFIFLLSNILLFFFSVANVNGKIFGFRDYEMTVSLPVKTWHIALSKILFLYLSNLGAVVALTVPFWLFGAAYLGFSAETHLSTLLLMFFTPLLPTTVAVFLGTLLALCTARMKHKNIIQTVLFVAIFLAAFIAPYAFRGDAASEDVANMASGLAFAAALYGKLWIAALYSLASAALFALPCLFIGKNFTKINTLVLSHRTRSKYKFREQKTAGKLKAVFVKELKRLFNSPVYAMNTLCGPILMLVMPFVVLFGTGGFDLAALRASLAGYGMQAALVLGLLSFFSGITPTTYCSISLEGKNLWILRSAPLSASTVLNAKLLVHALVETLPAFVITVAFGAVLGLNAFYIVGAVIFGTAMSFTFGIVGLLINLCFPMLEWENETIPVKRSKSCIFTMLADLLLAIAFGAVGFLLAGVNAWLGLAVIAVLSVAALLSGLYILYGPGEKLYANLIK